MTYRWLTDLDLALQAGGVPFVEVNEHPADYTGSASWRERGRPGSTGDFNPQGTLCHHTASPAGTSDEADINAILWGNSQAPGPISTCYVGRSGTIYLLAAGRCNHGGGGMRPGIDVDCFDMNEALLGIEAGNNGIGEVWPEAQTLAYAKLVAALHLWYSWPRGSCYLHATTGPPGGGCNSKIDPAGPWVRQPGLVGSTTWDLETWRDYCVEQAHAPLPPEGESMPQPCGFITCNQGVGGHHVDGSEYTSPVDGTTYWVSPAGTLQWVHAGELDTKVSVEAGAGRRTDTWNTPVGDPDVFGRLEGDKPHL